MSSLIVEICEIDDIYPHPNADNLEICKVKGWEVCIGKDKFKVGDRVVYFPPDCILPIELSDRLNITKYLANGRVKAANLRGVCSYGTIMPCELDLPVGTSVVDYYGITKYEQQIKATDGDAKSPDSVFHTYFSMENLRNFPDAFIDGEEVICTEKLHGQNARVGLIQVTNDKGQKVWSWAAGSHDVQRKQYITKDDGTQVKTESVFWKALTPEVKELLIYLSKCEYKAEEIDNGPPVKDDHNTNVILFSERFGSVQDLKYGFTNGEYEFRYFDIAINGSYVSAKRKYELFDEFNIKTVPILYNGPFIMSKMLELATGNTTVMGWDTEIVEMKDTIGKSHIREGIVIVSALESPCVTNKRVFSRTQFKLINPDYLTRKGKTTEYH